MPAFKGHNVGWVAVVVLLLLIILTTCLLVGIDGNEDTSVPPTTDPSTRTPTPTNATSALAAISPKNNSAVTEASEDPLIGGVSTVGALTTTTSQMPSTITANVSISTEDAATSATTKTTIPITSTTYSAVGGVSTVGALTTTTSQTPANVSTSTEDAATSASKVAYDGSCSGSTTPLTCVDNNTCVKDGGAECVNAETGCKCKVKSGSVCGKATSQDTDLECGDATDACMMTNGAAICDTSTIGSDCICRKVVYDGICSKTNATEPLVCEDANHLCLNSAKNETCNATDDCVCANPSFPHCMSTKDIVDVVFYDVDEDEAYDVDDEVSYDAYVMNDVYDDDAWRNGTYEGNDATIYGTISNDNASYGRCRWNGTIGDDCTDDDGDGWLEGAGCGDMKFLCCAEEVKFE